MASLNQCTLMGHLCRDPETRVTPGGVTITSTGLAINRIWKDAQGQKKEEVCFVDITAFGTQADVMQKYCKKGDLLLIVGRLRLEQWEDKQGGGKRSKHTVTIETLQLMPRKDGGDGGQATPQQQMKAPAKQQAAPRHDDGSFGNNDIPF